MLSLGVSDEPLGELLLSELDSVDAQLGVELVQLSVSVELSDMELSLLLDGELLGVFDGVESVGVERSLEPPPSGGWPVAQTGRYR